MGKAAPGTYIIDIQCSSQDCQAVWSWVECLQKDEIFVARQCAGRQEGNQYILSFSDHCMPTIWFLCNAEYDEYGNTGCGVFKRGLQN